MTEDYEIVAVERIGAKPNTMYFFPVITFIVLLYFNVKQIEIDSGYISAMLGVSIVSTLLMSAFVGWGLITNEWYSIKARGESVWGELLIGVISLFSSQVTFYVIGLVNNWFPNWNNVVWFTWGFLMFQLMWFAFTYFYVSNGGFTKDNRVNVFFGMVSSIAIGIAGVFVIL